jgi:glycerate 2-kinase
MNILIAPNSFKNSLSADAAAEAILKGLQQSKLTGKHILFPIGDGGDGTAALLTRCLKAKIINQDVHDPIGRKIHSTFGLTDHQPLSPDKTAIIELADASGLKLLQRNEYDPLHATTYGTGELIKFALDQEVKRIILCIGGSATVDGGMGILDALGARFYDDEGNSIRPQPISFTGLADVDVSKMDKRIVDVEMIVLCDVDNHLLGEKGAASIFGPQKGASPQAVRQLDAGLTKLRDLVFRKQGIDIDGLKYGGAAGGVAAGLHAFLNAKLVNGIDYFLDATGFDIELEKANLLITGEGSFDTQTLQGKGPFGVAKRAKEMSIPVIGLAGKVPLKPDKLLQEYFDILLPISHEAMDIETALGCAYDNLVRTAQALGNLLTIKDS